VVRKSAIFWDITPCSSLSVDRRFGGTYRLHLQGQENKFSKKPAKNHPKNCTLEAEVSLPPLSAGYTFLRNVSLTPTSAGEMFLRNISLRSASVNFFIGLLFDPEDGVPPKDRSFSEIPALQPIVTTVKTSKPTCALK
jgi:hypothetical protein